VKTSYIRDLDILNEGSAIFTAVKIQHEVLWVVTPCSVGDGPCCLSLHSESGGVDILLQNNMASQLRRPRSEYSVSQKFA